MQSCSDTLCHAQLYPLSHVRATGKTIPDALQPNSPDERMYRDPAILQEATPCPARHNAQRTEPATTQCQKYKPGPLTIPPLVQITICHGQKGKHSKLPSPTQNHVQPPHPTPPPTKHAIPANNTTKSQHTHPPKPSDHSTPKTSPRNPLTRNTIPCAQAKGKRHSPSCPQRSHIVEALGGDTLSTSIQPQSTLFTCYTLKVSIID